MVLTALFLFLECRRYKHSDDSIKLTHVTAKETFISQKILNGSKRKSSDCIVSVHAIENMFRDSESSMVPHIQSVFQLNTSHINQK